MQLHDKEDPHGRIIVSGVTPPPPPPPPSPPPDVACRASDPERSDALLKAMGCFKARSEATLNPLPPPPDTRTPHTPHPNCPFPLFSPVRCRPPGSRIPAPGPRRASPARAARGPARAAADMEKGGRAGRGIGRRFAARSHRVPASHPGPPMQSPPPVPHRLQPCTPPRPDPRHLRASEPARADTASCPARWPHISLRASGLPSRRLSPSPPQPVEHPD